MGIQNLTLILQVTFLTLVFLLSFCVFIPVGSNLYDFKGNCLLFTNGTWSETDGKFLANWASQVYCDYAIGFSLLSAVISFTMLNRFITYVCRQQDASFLVTFFDVVIAFLMASGSFAGSLIITFGYNVWCDAIMSRFEQCADASSNAIFQDDKIDTTRFYTEFGTSNFGSWALWGCWMAMGTTSLVKLCRFHNQDTYDSFFSNERRRLIAGTRPSWVVA